MRALSRQTSRQSDRSIGQAARESAEQPRPAPKGVLANVHLTCRIKIALRALQRRIHFCSHSRFPPLHTRDARASVSAALPESISLGLFAVAKSRLAVSSCPRAERALPETCIPFSPFPASARSPLVSRGFLARLSRNGADLYRRGLPHSCHAERLFFWLRARYAPEEA